MTRVGSLTITLAATLATVLAAAAPALGHGPDPILGIGTLWSRDEVVAYQWLSGEVPPGWMATAIDLGAGDVGESRNSRAAVFVRAATAPATIGYGVNVPCDGYGIACANRTGMTNNIFGVWFRPQGWPFDWGTLKWCQSYSTAPNGCYDAERVALDELGHIEVLGHHVNYSDESDYLDAIVQFAGRQKAREGWNAHAFGRCDVARLQLEYERRNPSNLVSTCLSLATSMTFASSTDSLVSGNTVRFTATLKIAVSSVAEAMSGDLLSDRPVVLQRRALGSSTWSTVGTMTPSSINEGAYTMTVGPLATYDWRATFATPTTEGVLGSTSGWVRVAVTTCTGGGCPLSATR
jgi:hypothetical protein